MPEPVQCLREVLDGPTCTRWQSAIEAEIDRRRPKALQLAPLRQGTRPLPSLRLHELPGVDFDALLAVLRAGALAREVRARLGPAVLCDVDQCWVRRQYPPRDRPPEHPPHSWHQDGALGHDFLRPDVDDGGLLTMATAWIALTPCGANAPALEWVTAPTPHLLPLAALTDAGVEALVQAASGTASGPRIESRVLAAGDALLFDGTLLHRTQVRASMDAMRTSIELRFFAPPAPARLGRDRFLPF